MENTPLFVYAMAESTTIHKPYNEAPAVTGLIAICRNCGVQWQVQGDADKLACGFCGADKSAISVKHEDLA